MALAADCGRMTGYPESVCGGRSAMVVPTATVIRQCDFRGRNGCELWCRRIPEDLAAASRRRQSSSERPLRAESPACYKLAQA